MKPTPTQLAREVLVLVRETRITPKTGAVMTTRERFPKKGYPLKSFLQRQDSCEACATGALLYAYCVNHHSVLSPGPHNFSYFCPNWDTVNLKEGMYATLAKFFSPLQLRLIEHSFEGIHHEQELRGEVLIACRNFYRYHPSTSLRLKAIMQNIIDHDGVFKP